MNNILSGGGMIQILDKHKPLLDQYGIEKIEYQVIGAGDSGDVSKLKVVPDSVDLKQMILDENDTRVQRSLEYHLESMAFQLVFNLLPGWEINEGNTHEFTIDVVKRKINVASTIFSTSEYNLLVPHALISQDVGVEVGGAIRVGRLSEVNPELYRLCVDNHIVEVNGQILGVGDGEEPGFWAIQLMFDSNIEGAETAFMEKHTHKIPWPTAEDLKLNQGDLNLDQLAAYEVFSYPPFFQPKEPYKQPTKITVNENVSSYTGRRAMVFDVKTGMSVRVDTLPVGPKLLQPMYDWLAQQLKEKIEVARNDWPQDVSDTLDETLNYCWVVVDAVKDEIRIGAIGNRQLSETFELSIKPPRSKL